MTTKLKKNSKMRPSKESMVIITSSLRLKRLQNRNRRSKKRLKRRSGRSKLNNKPKSSKNRLRRRLWPDRSKNNTKGNS